MMVTSHSLLLYSFLALEVIFKLAARANGDQQFPKLTTRQLHFTFTETLTSDLNSSLITANIEVYIDGDRKLTRMGIDNDYTINDFNLAVSYHFNLSECQIKSFNSYTPGLIGGQLDVNELTWMNGPFKYLGKTIYEPRARGVFDTWESVEYGRNIGGFKYDKVVTTQYMARLSDSNGSKYNSITYIPVAMVRIAYNKDTTGKYIVSESRRRDISEFQQAITKTQYQNLFGISDCFDKDQRKILTFDIRSEEYGSSCNTGIQFAEENMLEFKENFKNMLTKQVSPLRMNSISLDFHTNRISAKVEFLERSPLEKSFQAKDVKVKVDGKMLTSGGISAKNVDECLKTQITGNYFKKILYCPLNNGLCMNIDNPDDLPETIDANIDCKLYTFPLTNQYRLTKEIELTDLHTSSLRIENMIISMKCDNCTIPSKSYRYRITNVLDYTFLGRISQSINFREVQKSSTLPSDKLALSVRGSRDNFGDCYRTCLSESDPDCVTFSICLNGDSAKCLVSSDLFTTNTTLPSPNCTTFARNFLLEYHKSPNKQFTDTSVDVSVYSGSADDCAASCSQSTDCFSFQYCSNNQCTFTTSLYPVKKVRQDLFCDVYTPKKSKQFIITGSNVVDEFILSESKLDMEQCAALCYNWKEGNESCKSFNYCPEGQLESTCQLTRFMVGESNVHTFRSNHCFNFERLSFSIGKSGNGPHPPSTRSVFLSNDEMSSATMSISFAFLIVGLALGVTATSIYHTIHNRNKYRVTIGDQDSDD